MALKPGSVVGTLTAALFTIWEWIENPGGIFLVPDCTSWSIVLETGLSWFIPSFLIVGGGTLVVRIVWLFLYRRRCGTRTRLSYLCDPSRAFDNWQRLLLADRGRWLFDGATRDRVRGMVSK